MSLHAAVQPPKEFGTSGIWRRRLVLLHLPIALASILVLLTFMRFPSFDIRRYAVVDMATGSPLPHGTALMGSAEARYSYARQFSVATGYVATGLLGLTLLIGPANLLLRRRNPVSSYLRRDVGMWTATMSAVHVVFGLQSHGGGQLAGILAYFVAPDGGPLVNSRGLGNWTGLAAQVIVVLLAALSTDAALRELKARTWKDLQRLNYTLFALVLLHSFFYGALLRLTSPYTRVGLLMVITVVAGQATGIWLWRRRRARAAVVAAGAATGAAVGTQVRHGRTAGAPNGPGGPERAAVHIAAD